MVTERPVIRYEPDRRAAFQLSDLALVERRHARVWKSVQLFIEPPSEPSSDSSSEPFDELSNELFTG